MVTKELLTIADIAKELELPESTVRYYRNRFPAYISAVGKGRNRRYKPEALEALRTIAEGLRNNVTAAEVEIQLSRLYPITIEQEEEPQQSTAATQQQSNLAPMGTNIIDGERLIRALEILADQKNTIDRLDETSRDLQTRLEKLEQQRKPWWMKIFGSH